MRREAMRPALRATPACVCAAVLVVASACGRDDASGQGAPRVSNEVGAGLAPAAPEPEPEASDWAAHVGKPPSVATDTPGQLQPAAQGRQGPPPSAASSLPVPSIEPATMPDPAFEAEDQVPVRHLVYRVSFIVPPALRAKRPPLRAPAGELHVDVAQERLRARFLGPGWPVEDGTEVRLRDDVPGVYLFDGMGGRPLPPGQLAGWFQGAETGHAKALVGVRRDQGSGDHGPGDLVCALLAEWTQQDREELLPRCQNGALPLGFHFGLWSAELTAIVPLKLPRSKLRADSGHAPAPVAYALGRSMLDVTDMSHLTPVRMRAEHRVVEDPVGPEGAALEVDNRTDSRVVIVIEGVPIGWVRSHARTTFRGFTPGFYHVGAARPFGQPAMSPTLLHIPGQLRFGRN
jgi:hypothetical protein